MIFIFELWKQIQLHYGGSSLNIDLCLSRRRPCFHPFAEQLGGCHPAVVTTR